MNNKSREITEEIKKVVIGKNAVVAKILTAILAGGHILIEDIPGVGKTTLALAFAKAMSLEQNRVQFTPDVLPTDITGFSIYNKVTGEFEYKSGAVMCNLLLGDEINRTSPKTQSALLQVMEEGKVTVDGITRDLPSPFVVIATQNPVGSIGTQKLPESQLDRFMIKLSIGYPDVKSEINILKNRCSVNALESINSIASREEIITMQKEVEQVYAEDRVIDYIVRLSNETRNSENIQLGLSPRGSLALMKMAKSVAYLKNRDFVMPEDIQYIFKDVSAHRINLSAEARMNGLTEFEVLDKILIQVKPARPEVMPSLVKSRRI